MENRIPIFLPLQLAGLLPKGRKNLLCTDSAQFHNLFQHMLFAITDFIYVRKFRTEINIEIIK